MENKVEAEYKAIGRLFRGKRPVGFRLQKRDGKIVDFNREATAALIGAKKVVGLKAGSKTGKTFEDASFAFLGATELPSIQLVENKPVVKKPVPAVSKPAPAVVKKTGPIVSKTETTVSKSAPAIEKESSKVELSDTFNLNDLSQELNDADPLGLL